MTFDLTTIASAFEGAFPSSLATCAVDGTLNLIFVSQVHLVDAGHVAISEQFLRRTLANLVARPRAQACVIDAVTGAQYRLALTYLRRETDTPLVARIRAKVDAIARAAGKEGVFAVRGALVCRVDAVQRVPVAAPAAAAAPMPAPAPVRTYAPSAFGELAAALERCDDLAAVATVVLDAVARAFGYTHATLWLAGDEAAGTLVAAASCGYASSGVGSEVARGSGVVGICAERLQPIRIAMRSREETYARAASSQIEPPTLPGGESVLAVPLVRRGAVLGVLVVEDLRPVAFGEADERALQLVAQLASTAIVLAGRDEAPAAAAPLVVRYYQEDDSVFVDDAYVIKGVAGRILWAIVQRARAGRAEITNRELRLDPAIGLSMLRDNLEARLLVLRARLAERVPRIRFVATGRGQARVEVDGPLVLDAVPVGRR